MVGHCRLVCPAQPLELAQVWHWSLVTESTRCCRWSQRRMCVRRRVRRPRHEAETQQQHGGAVTAHCISCSWMSALVLVGADSVLCGPL